MTLPLEKKLKESEINGKDLKNLLLARNQKVLDFLLIDVREKEEYEKDKIIGVDFLIPSSLFFESFKRFDFEKNQPIVLYCHSGSRSRKIQEIMKKLDYKNVINLNGGIVNYPSKSK